MIWSSTIALGLLVFWSVTDTTLIHGLILDFESDSIGLTCSATRGEESSVQIQNGDDKPRCDFPFWYEGRMNA